MNIDKVDKEQLVVDGNNLFEIQKQSIKALKFKKVKGGWEVSANSRAKEMRQIIIPNLYKDKPVVSISCEGFSELHNLIEVKIPNSVTDIGYSAFAYCDSLTEVTMPNGLKNISYKMFYECKSLMTVKIPNHITSIGVYAFAYCDSLLSVSMPYNLKSIGYKTFYECRSLNNIVLPNNLTIIGANAFTGCRKMKNLVFKNIYGWYRESEPINPLRLEDPSSSAQLIKDSGIWQKS